MASSSFVLINSESNLFDSDKTVNFNHNSQRVRTHVYVAVVSFLILLCGCSSISFSLYIKFDVDRRLELLQKETNRCRCTNKSVEVLQPKLQDEKLLLRQKRAGSNEILLMDNSEDASGEITNEQLKLKKSFSVSDNISSMTSHETAVNEMTRERRAPTNGSQIKAKKNRPRVVVAGDQQIENNQKKKKFSQLVAAHYTASSDVARQYESGPTVSFNSSTDRDLVYRFWRQASWVEKRAADLFYLDESTGLVTVEQDGLYFIYAQVTYHDLSGRWAFGIDISGVERVKCLVSEQLGDLTRYDHNSHGVYQHCYTALALYIRKNSNISIRCMYGSRKILTKPEFTFWGIVKL